MSIFSSIMERLGGAPGTAPASQRIDVVAEMEKRTAEYPQQLYWRHSILDMLKLLDIDSSLDSRQALATELGVPAKVMSDPARMNLWLHRELLSRIAANGGTVPAGVLD
jgi:hypothetical protein